MNLQQAQKITGGLSHPSKMPCMAFAISAKICITGRKLYAIAGSVCSKCYALRGRYTLPSVLVRLHKYLDGVRNPLWVKAMALQINLLEYSGYFRWFSSGDLQSLGMLIKICEVCRRTPKIRHWMSTREVGILSAYRTAGFTFPDNLVIRFCATMIEEQPPKELMKFHQV